MVILRMLSSRFSLSDVVLTEPGKEEGNLLTEAGWDSSSLRDLKPVPAEAESEVRASKDEVAQHKERCEHLEARVLALEAGAAENDMQLRASEKEREQVAERLGASEAVVAEKALALQEAHDEISKLKQDVATVGVAAAESQDELCKVQSEKSECEERCKELESRLAKDPAGGNMELKTLLIENAKYEERCEQLKANLAKAETKLDKMRTLWEEKAKCMAQAAKYEERCRQLERQLTKSEEQLQRLSGRFLAQPMDERSSVCSEASWVHLSDAGSAAMPRLAESANSGISVDTSGADCFMLDATFTAESGLPVLAKDLHEGSKIRAADGSVVAVAAPLKQREALQCRALREPTPRLYTRTF